MRLHVSIGQTDINGYVNLDLSKHKVDFNNMDTICEAAECTEIWLDQAIAHIPIQQVPFFIQQFVSRLRKNGRIIIDGFDINCVVKAYINGTMSLADINYALFGINSNFRKASCISHNDVQNILTESKITISSVELNNSSFTVIGTREG